VLITGREEAERIAKELGGENPAEFFEVVERPARDPAQDARGAAAA